MVLEAHVILCGLLRFFQRGRIRYIEFERRCMSAGDQSITGEQGQRIAVFGEIEGDIQRRRCKKADLYGCREMIGEQAGNEATVTRFWRAMKS